MSRPRIALFVPTFQPRDAVGNDVLGMYKAFGQAGYPTSIFAQYIHSDYAPFTNRIKRAGHDRWGDILIYHHAIHWPLGEEILSGTRSQAVVKYHNVTPPRFYTNYAQTYYWACVEGTAATKRLAQLKRAWFWGDSKFNADELVSMGAPAERSRVAPPLHQTEEIAAAPLDTMVVGSNRGSGPNILFVGAFRPNKGHCKALECFAAYLRLSQRPARLFFVGGFDPKLSDYVEEVKEYARCLGIDGQVCFCPSVNLSQMRAYYHIASVFLCVSEHEGFCVPLVEAMYFRTPIVAWGSTAVGETVSGSGISVSEFEPGRIAQAIDECVENPVRARCLATRQRHCYEETFRPEILQQRLLTLLEEVIGEAA